MYQVKISLCIEETRQNSKTGKFYKNKQNWICHCYGNKMKYIITLIACMSSTCLYTFPDASGHTLNIVPKNYLCHIAPKKGLFKLCSTARVGSRSRTCLPRRSQTCSTGLRSGEYGGHSILSMPSSSKNWVTIL